MVAAALPLAAAALVGISAIAAEPVHGMAAPPTGYRLDAVSLQIERQPGHGQPKVSFSVDRGSATLESGRVPQRQSFPLPEPDLLKLVNGLYGLRFFDLPSMLLPRTSVFMQADGAVGLQSTTLSDTTSTSVCFKLPTYEKCVRYSQGQAPRELQDWVDSTLSGALLRVTRPPAGASSGGK